MSYEVKFLPGARRSLRRLDHVVQVRLVSAIEALADEPRPTGCKKLQGDDKLYRIRVGEYRVIYDVKDGLLQVLVIDLGHRSNIYR